MAIDVSLLTAAQAVQATGGTPDFWDVFEDGYEGPLYAPMPWDTVTIGGIQIPGIVSVKSGSVEKKIDIQKPHGRDGGALIERGLVPGKFDIDVLLWTPEQWAKWKEIRPFLYRRAGKLDFNDRKRKVAADSDVALAEKAALTVMHPALASVEITRMLIASITIPVVDREDKTVSFTIRCVEYLPPGKKTAVRKANGVKAPAAAPFLLNPTVNKPAAPSKTDGGPNGPKSSSHGSH